MKLEDAWDRASTQSGKASDAARSLALGAIALVWIFRDTTTSQIPKVLVWPAVTAMMALALDLAQSALAGHIWRTFSAQKEEEYERQRKETALPELTLDTEIGDAPRDINRWPFVLYWAKLASLLASYSVLLCYAAGRLLGE